MKAHGEWLPWLAEEIESGRLEVKSTQARVYMRVASNIQRGVHLPETTSIRAALELFSDKDDVKQGDLISSDVEAERKAREEAETKAEAERQARPLTRLEPEVQRRFKSSIHTGRKYHCHAELTALRRLWAV